jgi:ribosomal protein L37AE/L43A
MTFDEFTSRFATEEQCREYLFRLRWPDGFACPKCGHAKHWKVGASLHECAGCGHQSSVV